MAFEVDKKKIAKNTIALYIRMGITMIVGFFTTRIMLEQLGSEDYGLNNLVGSIVSLMGFINGSMGTAIQRYYSVEIGRNNQEKLNKVFSTGMYLHIIVAIVSVIIAEMFAALFLSKLNIPQDRLFAAHIVFQVSVLSMVLSIVSVPYTALLRAREMFSKMAIYDIMQAFLRLGVLFLLIVLPYDKLISLSMLNLGITIIYTIAMVIMAREFQEAHSKPSRDSELIKQMASFVSLLLFTVLASLLNTKGLVVLINLFFGLEINAAYAVAVQVQTIVNTFVMNFKQSLVPQMMSSFGAGDIDKMKQLITTGTKIMFILLLFISLPIVFESGFLLSIWLKEPPQFAAQLVSLVIININISSFSYFLYQGVHATGKIRGQQIWMSSAYVSGILLTFIVFKMGFSFYYAMYISFLISFIQCFVNLWYSHKSYNYSFKEFINVTMKCLLCAVIAAGILVILIKTMDEGWLRFVVIGAASSIVVIILGYFMLLNKKERNQIRLEHIINKQE